MALPKVKPSDPAEHVIRTALVGAIARFQANDSAARLGDVEGVHRLRTATRRLRGELRTFRHLLEPAWRGPIEVELKWLAGVLGGVRDLDVLDNRLRTAAGLLGWDDPRKYPDVTPARALDPLFEAFRRRHAEASAVLREALRGDRYAHLVEAIGRSLESVPEHVREEAAEPCRDVLPPLLRSSWKHLKRQARTLKPDDPDENFHDVRKRSKKARYTAELIAPALGRRVEKQACPYIRLTTRVQDVLGEHQDAAIAVEEIARVRDEQPGNPLFSHAADLLIDDQREAAKRARDSFFKVWEKVDRKKVRRWMTPQ